MSKFHSRFLRFASSGVVRKRFAVGMLLSFFIVLFAGGILAVAAGGNRFIRRYQMVHGRRCVTCHQPSDAFSVSPPHILQRFNATQGTDPIFRLVDGANCTLADAFTVEERRRAHSLLSTWRKIWPL